MFTNFKPGLRVIVCGGRDYQDHAHVNRVLDELSRRCGSITVIEGGATGADALARHWAKDRPNVQHVAVPAHWDDISHPHALIRVRRDGKRYDTRAGFRRNQQMIDLHAPDLILAFPGGSGTIDMIKRGKKAGLHVTLQIPLKTSTAPRAVLKPVTTQQQPTSTTTNEPALRCVRQTADRELIFDVRAVMEEYHDQATGPVEALAFIRKALTKHERAVIDPDAIPF